MTCQENGTSTISCTGQPVDYTINHKYSPSWRDTVRFKASVTKHRSFISTLDENLLPYFACRCTLQHAVRLFARCRSFQYSPRPFSWQVIVLQHFTDPITTVRSLGKSSFSNTSQTRLQQSVLLACHRSLTLHRPDYNGPFSWHVIVL